MCIETRMTTFIKTKFKISDDQTKIDINKEIVLLWSRESFEEGTLSDLESPSNFPVKEKKKY